MRLGHADRGRSQVHMVTQARRSLSEDISFRQRRYLLMMGVRALCFIIAVVMFVNHLGWLTVIPAAGAIFIPYFAVVFANGGREPSSTAGFRAYEPPLPVRHVPSEQGFNPRTADPGSAAGHQGNFTDSAQAPETFTDSNRRPKGSRKTPAGPRRRAAIPATDSPVQPPSRDLVPIGS